MSGIHVACQCGQQFAADLDRAGQTLPCPFLLKNGDAELIIPNLSYQLRLQLRVNSGWKKNLTIELPDIDYAIDSSHPDPRGELRRRQEAAFVGAIETLTILDFSIPTPDVLSKVFGESQDDVNGERLTVNFNYRAFLERE